MKECLYPSHFNTIDSNSTCKIPKIIFIKKNYIIDNIVYIDKKFYAI